MGYEHGRPWGSLWGMGAFTKVRFENLSRIFDV